MTVVDHGQVFSHLKIICNDDDDDGNDDNDDDDSYHISQSESVQELVPEENIFCAQLRNVAVCLMIIIIIMMMMIQIHLFAHMIIDYDYH